MQYYNNILAYNSTEFIKALFSLCLPVSVQASMRFRVCLSVCFLKKKILMI